MNYLRRIACVIFGSPKIDKDSGSAAPSIYQQGISALSPNGIARILLASTATYIFFASIFVCWMEVRELRYLNLYYLAIACFLSFTAASALNELSWHKSSARFYKIELRSWVIVGLGAVAWLLYRDDHLFKYSLWLDEITQFQGDWDLPRKFSDPTAFAAAQQQPPIDYYLSAFSRITLGFNQFAAQANAMLFSLLGLFVFLLWLIRVRLPLALAPIPILLFCAHHSLLRFSTEARPVSLAVFFALLTAFFAYERLHDGKTSYKALFASASLLLYSIGLQPLFFLASMVIGLAPLALMRFKKVEAIKFVSALGLAPLALFSPLLLVIYLAPNTQSQFRDASFFAIWVSELRNLEWADFSEYLNTIRQAEWLLAIPAAAIAIGLIAKLLSPKKSAADAAAWGLAALLFSFSFPILFQVFWQIIEWQKHTYYFVLWPVGLFTLGSLCLAKSYQIIPRGKLLVAANLALLIIGAYVSYSLHHTYAQTHATKVRSIYNLRPNWKKIFEKASRPGRPIIVVGMPYGHYDYSPYHSVSGAFYEKPPAIRVVKSKTFEVIKYGVSTINLHESFRQFNSRADVLYVMTLLRFSDDDPNQSRKRLILSTVKRHVDEVTELGENLLLLRSNDQELPMQKTKSLFKAIIEADPKSKRNFYLADALANESIRNNDCIASRMWFDLMDPALYIRGQKPDEKLRNYLGSVKQRISQIPFCEPVRYGQSQEQRAPAGTFESGSAPTRL